MCIIRVKLNETSVRKFKSKYLADLKERVKKPGRTTDNTAQELVSKIREQPLLVGEDLDAQVRKYVKELRKFGVVINTHIVIVVGMVTKI